MAPIQPLDESVSTISQITYATLEGSSRRFAPTEVPSDEGCNGMAKSLEIDPENDPKQFLAESLDPNANVEKRQDKLARKLNARQIQMIAIGGTIGTGLFLGTGKSLATGGPASMMLGYLICGFIVYNTMLCLGEMATYMPIAGTFTTYASRFVDEGFGFALTWNYWFNDAVSVAGDLVAARIILSFWTESMGHSGDTALSWAVTILLWSLIVGVNALGVRWYGEIEYSLSLLKVVTIIFFIIVGLLINVGANVNHDYIGFENWRLPGAPFVGGIGGFASVFVTAAFAFGGTESIGVTAGETKNPRKNMPKVIKNVFWRVLIFYVFATFIIGLNVPYNTPGLKAGDVEDSPFTLVFSLAGLSWAAHFINAVIMTSVISAGNHALFAGTRLLYAMSCEGQAPGIFKNVTEVKRVPLAAMILTAAISCICFASSFIGNGRLWSWLQALVGVSNQIAWVSIGWSNWRFREALKRQSQIRGTNPEDELPFRNWLYPFSPIFVIVSNSFLILVQGWKSFVPDAAGHIDVPTLLSYYIEIPFLLLMWLIWKLIHKTSVIKLEEIDLDTDRYQLAPNEMEEEDPIKDQKAGKLRRVLQHIL